LLLNLLTGERKEGEGKMKEGGRRKDGRKKGEVGWEKGER
jgi:hypothetical protein